MSQLYWDAAQVLKQVLSKQRSLKSASFSSRHGKVAHELVRKVLPHYRRLQKEIKKISPRNMNVSILMLYDYYTIGKISGGGLLKKQITSNFEPFQIPVTSSSVEKIWVRVNEFNPPNVALIGEADPIVKNLFFVEKSKDVKEMMQKGQIIVQSKASCLPVNCVRFVKGDYNAIDACAAPGNKTIQLAELMKEFSTGKVFAFEKDEKRFAVLEKRLKLGKVTNVQCQNLDFFEFGGERNVKIAIVDPSCSGSGIIEHQIADFGEIRYEPNYTDNRIENLASFQESILQKALSLKGIEQVVYSTCSVYKRENEQVVKNVMSQLWRQFKLENILKNWETRGIGKYGKFMVRCVPNQTNSQGFFVAKIVKRKLRLRHKLLKNRKIFWHIKKIPVFR